MALPDGYSRIRIGSTEAVAAEDIADEVRGILQGETLHHYAEHHPLARPLSGRGIAFAVPIGHERAVVRHNRHGGFLAPLTGDLFLAPTRAPLELDISVELAHRGVPTPPVLSFAVYSAPAIWRRADVATREVPDSFDLGHALQSQDAELRVAALEATAELIRVLGRARARHEDLNVKNVLLAEAPRFRAWLLDVDRVTFKRADPTSDNVRRLLRSVEQRGKNGGAGPWPDELGALLRMLDR